MSVHAKVKIKPEVMAKVVEATAYGVLNACHAVEGAAKALTPVHGDPNQGGPFKTFAPGAKPIGGTLRRSIHSVVYHHGEAIEGSANEQTTRTPVFQAEIGGALIEGWVGTNLYYASWVHDGTVKMPARPFLAAAMADNRGKINGLVEAGARKKLALMRSTP